MFIGDKSRFAIEYELDETDLPPAEAARWLYGRICWWARGERIGTYAEHETTGEISGALRFILKEEGTRFNRELFQMPSEDALMLIVKALYLDDGQSDEQMAEDARKFSRFYVSPGSDVFDDWRIVLIEGERSAKLLWCRQDYGPVQESILELGEFERVAGDYLKSLPTGL
jgi:hypothetical protein